MSLRSLRLGARKVSVYDLYIQTATLEGQLDNSCRSVDSLFSYLFVILQDDKVSLSSEEQVDRIYKQLSDNDKLTQTGKNNKYIALFLACAIFFLSHLKKSGLGTTYEAFLQP